MHSNEAIIVSNGHISPAIYAILSELKIVDKKEFIEGFRSLNSKFEGHVSRFVEGCFYSTGPLGTGTAVASGLALAKKYQKSPQKVYTILGDGESQEGIIYEMSHFASKYKLNNLVCILDSNKVQLSNAVDNIMPIDLQKSFQAAGFEVLECDGHNYQEIFNTYQKADQSLKPVIILMNTIMGYGSKVMQEAGQKHQATWHGKSPSDEDCAIDIQHLELTTDEQELLAKFFQENPVQITPQTLTHPVVNPAKRIVYTTDDLLDCRTAYGNALKDLGENNPNILALTADLGGSVKTHILKQSKPDQHFDVGVAEQLLVAAGGGISLAGLVPFVSTFGVFMTSRARGQARLNDINKTNLKMVSTHCGLSLGEDGPTHQALDDYGSMASFFHTIVIEPADANQTDAAIRYIAQTYGNFYVRLGRHKYPVLTKADGSPFFDENYDYSPFESNHIVQGSKVTLITSGSTSYEALQAALNYPGDIDLFIASSPKAIDQKLLDSIAKTQKLIVVQDHNHSTGLYSFVAQKILESDIPNIQVKSLGIQQLNHLSVDEYQLSGKQKDLYAHCNLDAAGISKQIDLLL